MGCFHSNLMALEMAPYRAISYQQLMDLDEEVKEEGWTMRDVCRNMIIPRQKQGLSYAATKNPRGLKLDVFVTHCWDEPFKAFCRSIEEVFHHKYHKPNLWICAFAIRQGNAEDIGRALEGDLQDSPFVRALRKASTFLVVRNEVTDIYTRAWCVCELLYAKQQANLFPGNTLIAGPDTHAHSISRCEDASASHEEDQAKILKKLKEHGYHRIDRIVRQFRLFPRVVPDDGDDEVIPVETSNCCQLRTRKTLHSTSRMTAAALLVSVYLCLAAFFIFDHVPSIVKSNSRHGLSAISERASELSDDPLLFEANETSSNWTDTGPCSVPLVPAKFWTNELVALKELEVGIGKSIKVFDNDCGDLPYPSAHLTLTASQNGQYAGLERCVVELSISGQGLSKLPADTLPRMQCLTFLDLSHNNLTELPDIFNLIPTLTYVDLRGNSLLFLPPSLSQMQQQGKLLVDALPFILEERIDKEEIGAVNDVNAAIENKLELGFEGHSSIGFKRAETNGYPIFGLAQRRLDSAENLILVRNHNMQVHDIFLQRQHLTTLPESVFKLKSLRNLSLRNNNFTKFPDTFGRESLPSLSTLDIAENSGLIALPVYLQQRIHSHDLRIVLDDPIQVPMEHLLTPDEAGAIRELETLLGGRKIPIKSEVAGSFGMTIDKGRVRDLAIVDLELNWLPDSFGNLTDLVTLDLSGNRLKLIPDLFWNFPYLHTVNFKGNPLKELPRSLANSPGVVWSRGRSTN